MRCAKARRLMALNRPGEVEPEVMRELERHVAGCPRCAAVSASVHASAGAVASLRSTPPRLDDPEGLALSIMRSIEAERHPTAHRRPSTGLFSSGRATAICSAAALAICTLFFVQTYADAVRIESLEQRMRTGADVAAAQERSMFASRRSAVAKARGFVAQGDREQLLAAGDLGGVLSVIRSSGLGSTAEMDRLRSKYPRLWSLSLDHGIDPPTREVLRTEGKAFLRDVEALVRLGE